MRIDRDHLKRSHHCNGFNIVSHLPATSPIVCAVSRPGTERCGHIVACIGASQVATVRLTHSATVDLYTWIEEELASSCTHCSGLFCGLRLSSPAVRRLFVRLTRRPGRPRPVDQSVNGRLICNDCGKYDKNSGERCPFFTARNLSAGPECDDKSVAQCAACVSASAAQRSNDGERHESRPTKKTRFPVDRIERLPALGDRGGPADTLGHSLCTPCGLQGAIRRRYSRFIRSAAYAMRL